MTSNSPKSNENSRGMAPIMPSDIGRVDIIDLGAVIRGLARCKWFIFALVVIGVALGVQRLRNFSPSYEASIVVAPSQGTVSGEIKSGSGIRGVAEGFGILISGAKSNATTFDRLRFTIGSIPLVRILERDYDIIRRMFKSAWDAKANQWKVPTGERFEFEQKVRRSLHLTTWRAPSLESFAEYLKSVIVIGKLVDVPFYKISFQHSDRETARWLLETVYVEADNLLRHQDRERAKQRKAYIEERMRETNVVEQRLMLISMLASEERRLMLLESDLVYAAEIVEPVFVSSRPTVPNILKDFGLVVFIWFAAGVGLSLIYVLYRAERS